MILSNEDVKRLLKRGSLAITPKPNPDQISPGSVDLTLSNEFWKFKPGLSRKTLDLDSAAVESLTKKVVAESIVLKPGELVLGMTVERLTLPPDICGHLEGRSRYARKGLAIHVTSSFVQPGSDNRQLLEIVNFAPYAMLLRAGLRCTQVVFEELKTPTSKPYRRFGTVAVRQ